jgi:hypothetical protein
MRRLGAWGGVGIALALVAGAVYAGSSGEDANTTDQKPDGGNWLSRWFAPKPKPPEKNPPPKGGKDGPDKSLPPAKRIHRAPDAATQRAREEAKYMRRSEVCAKLQAIAEQTNDSSLRQKAEQMEVRAWNVYLERTKHLASSRHIFESDHKTLEKHLGSIPTIDEHSGASAIYTVPAHENRSTAQEE